MQNDFFFTPASTTSLEACCIGIPMIVGIIADNQIEIASILEKREAALNIGWYSDNSADKIKKKFLKLMNDDDKLRKFAIRQKMIIDGQSDRRYREIFSEFLNGNSH